MTAQRLVLIGGYPDGVWACAWCAAELNESEIIHGDDCRWIAEIAAAERERVRQFARETGAWVAGKQVGPMRSERGRFFADLLEQP